MSRPPERLDEYGEADPHLNRYAWALRRALPLIAAGALVLGVLMALTIGGPEHKTTTTLTVGQATPTLASVGFGEDFEDVPPTFDVMQYLMSDEADTSGVDNSAIAVLDVANDAVITLTVTAESGADVQVATAARLQAVSDWVGQRRANAAADLTKVIDAHRAEIVARRAELDAEIATLPDSEALRDAFLDERATLTTNLLQADSQETAVTSFVASAQRIDVLSSSTKSSNLRVVWFIVGAVLGALLATAVVVVLAHSDRKVRRRSDLLGIVGGAPLPVIPRAGAEHQVALQATRNAISRLSAGEAVLLVPSENGAARAVADELATGLSASVVAANELTENSEVTPPAVIVAAGGRSNGDDVARVHQYLDALGCDVLGAVLGDVSARDLRRAVG